MNTFAFKEIEKQIKQWIQLDYISPEDIPSIELYMDQITTFMDKQLAGNKRQADDKILTKTMINNYSKNSLLPPSDKKKYSKDHIIMSDIYSNLFQLEQQYGIHIRDNVEEVCKIAEQQFGESDDYLKTFAMIIMLSYDIYAKKQLIERLIDSVKPPVPSKAELKEAKQKEKQVKKEQQ